MHEYAPRLHEDYLRSAWPLPQLAAQRLTWWPQIGIGWHAFDRPRNEKYDQNYFDNFERNANTSIGQSLMRARVAFVAEHYHGPLVDVGIGSGAFIELRPQTYGYDVNPAGINWLKDRGLLVDPYTTQHDAMSMWDVLEHVGDFPELLANAKDWLFLSLPIFTDCDHVLRSKHFKPNEHCWYFTRDGLVWILNSLGFELVAENSMETELGREDIGTFAFRRVADAD